MLDADEVAQNVRNGRVAVNTLLIAEADNPRGPWHFRRDPEGRPRDLFKDSPVPWLFAHVQPLGDHGFLLTGGGVKISRIQARDFNYSRSKSVPSRMRSKVW